MKPRRRAFIFRRGCVGWIILLWPALALAASYEGTTITVGMFDRVTEASYGRVFRHALPGKDNRYVMLLMGNNDNTRRIYLATSKDGRKWEPRRAPFMDPPAGTDQVAGAIYFPWRLNRTPDEQAGQWDEATAQEQDRIGGQ
jgi:hypothetical protein